MRIRIPPKADTDLRAALDDIVEELGRVRQELEEVRTSHTASNVAPAEALSPSYTDAASFGTGHAGPGSVLTSDGAGNASWTPLLDGALVTVTPGKAGTSLANRVVEVHGSLAVTGGLQADTVFCRKLSQVHAEYQDTYYDDLRIEPIARNTGARAPSFEQWADDSGLGDTGTTNGVYLYSFDDATAGSEKEIFFTMQMPHCWKLGTAIHLHLHWIGAVADTTAEPRWGLEYVWKDIGQVFGATATIIYADAKLDGTGVADPDVTAGKHYLSEFADLTPDTTADGLSSILIGRIFRDSANPADTYNAAGAKCGLLYIDAHYEIDTPGSSDEFTK
jgi:hypothetical protein